MTTQAGGDIHLVHEAIIANGSLATETISNMPSSSTTPAAPPAADSTGSSGSTSSTADSCTCIGQAYNTTFGMPSGIKLSQFDGSNWSNWSGILEALLTLHEAKDVFALKPAPSRVDKGEWDSLQRRTKVYLCIYVKRDIFSLVASAAKFPTFKDKWEKLKQVYDGGNGRTTIFNLLVQLPQA